ncbi:helix-turn-helix domain-containing protein [Marinobacter sp. ELB17]|uniref:helix-turn-helix domain-containing protein n=1 Tax=Marinobacter sp. ELB17 TaxID=270374 RepID=UPI0000F36A85|nr:helix-turn-helix domain-containing protein [Marinobacter sp. ELB17]EAZ97473.1 transcriptional regulator, XRE family protein [Marinobacter sp. ELB17]
MTPSNNRLLTSAAQDALQSVGEHIKLARQRRKLSQSLLADRAGVGVVTVRRLEKGESVGIDTLANILVALNLEDTLLKVASPSEDEVGIAMEKRQTPKRIRKRSSDDLDTNF